jgi:predicted Zn-dependent peptidase
MMMDNLMYPDQPFGRDILGTKQTVSSFTRKDLVNFYKTHYGPENTLVVIAGGINTKQIEKEVKKLFGAAKKSGTKKQIITDPKVSAKGKRKDILNKKTDQVHMALAIEAPGYEDADRYNVEILATILGRGMSSRLFIKMREELGICYYAHAGYAKLTNAKGQFHIVAGVDTARTQIALNGIWEECIKLATTEVDEDELKKVKQMLKSGLAMSMETCEDVASFYASQYIRNGKALTIEQIYKKIDAVKTADVLQMAKKLFVVKNVHLTAIGEGIGKLSL